MSLSARALTALADNNAIISNKRFMIFLHLDPIAFQLSVASDGTCGFEPDRLKLETSAGVAWQMAPMTA